MKTTFTGIAIWLAAATLGYVISMAVIAYVPPAFFGTTLTFWEVWAGSKTQAAFMADLEQCGVLSLLQQHVATTFWLCTVLPAIPTIVIVRGWVVIDTSKAKTWMLAMLPYCPLAIATSVAVAAVVTLRQPNFQALNRQDGRCSIATRLTPNHF